jgi:hypothetical protein
MKKFLVLLITLSSLKIVSQVPILNEPFTTANVITQALPSGWTRDAGTGWVSDDGTGSFVPSCALAGSSAGTLVVADNSSPGLAFIQSKLFSSAGYSNITMEWNQFNASSAPSMTLEWSADGASWTTITAFTNNPATDIWYNATATLQTAADQNPTLYVRFSYIADGLGSTNYNFIGLDDVKVFGTVSPSNYYWNGGNTIASPAAGGSGSWATIGGWRIASPIGPQANWLNNSYAVFSGTAGLVTVNASRTALGYSFNTSSYTLQTTSPAPQILTGPISLDNNVELVLAPNFTNTGSGIIGIGNVNGIGACFITIFANSTSTAGAARLDLATANASINVPTNIVSASGIGLAGYVATANGCVINGNITNNSTLRTIIGATTGILNVNGVIGGSAGLQISAGATGGLGRINFNNTNTYAGSTIFNAASTATIALGTNNAFPNTTNLTMGAAANVFTNTFGGIFDLNGYNQTIGNIGNGAGSGTVIVGSGTITNNSSISNSTLTITQTTAGSFNRSIRDGAVSKIAIVKNGSSALTLNGLGTAYGFSGGLDINAGELRFNPTSSPVNISSCPVTLNGGILSSSSISLSSVVNFSTLNVADNSTISLSSTNAHTLNFAASNVLGWTPSRTLTIIGWQGIYTNTVGSSGTVGKIFVGSMVSGLSASQLSQIKFFDGSAYYDATILSTGEIVPVPAVLLTQLQALYCSYTATSNVEFIWADSLNTPSTQFNWRYRFKLFDGTNNIIWTTSNEWPILQFYQVSGVLFNTTYTVSVAWSNDNGSNFSAYGATCALTSPSNPTTQLSSSFCGSSPANYTTMIIADFVAGATQYEYRFATPTATQTLLKSNNNFILAQVPGLLSNTTYSVSVRVFVNGLFGSYGPSCNLTTPNGPTTQLSSSFCGSSPATYTTFIIADFVAGATQYEYRFATPTVTQTLLKSNNNFILAQVPGLLNNTTYSVSVRVFVNGSFGSYGSSCNLTTPNGPTTQLSSSFCGSSPATYTTFIIADFVAGATQYEYRFATPTVTQTLLKSNNNFILAQVAGLSNNTTYSVSVRVLVNGSFGNYGSSCNITTPNAPTTKLSPSFCGSSPATYTTFVIADFVPGLVTQYEYRFATPTVTQTLLKSNNNFILAQVGGLTISTTYSVQVRVLFNGVWGNYGPVCSITTPGSLRPAHEPETTEPIKEVEEMQQAQQTRSTVGINSESVDATKKLFEATVYPNPYQNEFAINISNYNLQEQLSIKVVDATGRLIEQQVLMPEQLKNISLGTNYDAGVYVITIKHRNNIKYIKLIKQ